MTEQLRCEGIYDMEKDDYIAQTKANIQSLIINNLLTANNMGS